MTKRVSFPFRGLSLPNSERALARAHSSQNGNHNLGLGVLPKTEPQSASSSMHFSSNHHHHHLLFLFPFPLHPSTRPYPRTKTTATCKRRGDRGEDNKKGGCKGAPAVFYLFFSCLTQRGRNAGRVRPSPPLFYATKGGPSPSRTCFGERTPSPLVSKATGRGSPPPLPFSMPTGMDPSLTFFDATGGESREDGREDNERSRREGVPAVFFPFF